MNLTNANPLISNILIVDDIPDNLRVLGDILKSDGYKVRPVPNGKLALQVAEKEKPDLILLDIMMPNMDGYEVCRQLKANPLLCDIPVIFISALNETNDIVKALQCGGADYITKPFHAEEVKARVTTHLNLYVQKQQLKQQSHMLQELNDTKDKFFSIISHDLRGPLGAFVSLTKIIAEGASSFTKQDYQEFNSTLNESATNLYTLMENLLEWARMQRGAMEFHPLDCSLKYIVQNNIDTLQGAARLKDINLFHTMDADIRIIADVPMLNTVIRNLLSNAVKFTPKGGKVEIGVGKPEDSNIRIYIKDSGIGMF